MAGRNADRPPESIVTIGSQPSSHGSARSGRRTDGVSIIKVPSALVRPIESALGRDVGARDRLAGGEIVRPDQRLRVRHREIARDVGDLEDGLRLLDLRRVLHEVPAHRQRLGQAGPERAADVLEMRVELGDAGQPFGRHVVVGVPSAPAGDGAKLQERVDGRRSIGQSVDLQRHALGPLGLAALVVEVAVGPHRHDRPVRGRGLEQVPGEPEVGLLGLRLAGRGGLEPEAEVGLELFARRSDGDAAADRDGVDRGRLQLVGHEGEDPIVLLETALHVRFDGQVRGRVDDAILVERHLDARVERDVGFLVVGQGRDDPQRLAGLERPGVEGLALVAGRA